MKHLCVCVVLLEEVHLLDFICAPIRISYGTKRLQISIPLVIEHSHGKWPIEIDGLPMNKSDFPWLCES